MHIVASYGIAERNIYREIKWVEDTLIQARTCSLSGRKAPLKSNMEYEVILVDATGSPIERPKKAKAILFRDEKWHTLKTQVLVDFKTGTIISLARANGKNIIYGYSRIPVLMSKRKPRWRQIPDIMSMLKYTPAPSLPQKSFKNHPLSKQKHKENREFSKKCIFAEHAIRFVGRLRILSERYHNRRKRFALRLSDCSRYLQF